MIVVFGSINLDLVTRVDRFPAPGETITGRSFATYPGGKGANQALAAARAGARVQMFGAVGDDRFADAALALLRDGRVDLGGVQRVAAPTGCATILVASNGENCIAVVPGANAHASPDTLPDSALSRDSLLLLQQEVPIIANAALIARARRLGARIVFNAAPAHPLSLDLLQQLDVLIVNEDEAAMLAAALGWPAASFAFASAAVAATANALTVIVTLGERGAVAACGTETIQCVPPHVDVVDTTAAGDAFVGALAAALDGGSQLRDALRTATAAGSLACTVSGAQPAMPHHDAIAALLPSVTARTIPRC